jgi:type I restriction enzyme S subunit
MGQAPSGDAYNDDGEGYPLIAGAGDFGESHPAPKKFTREAAKLSHREDIILGIRATIGEKVWSDSTYALGRGVAALRPSSRLDRHYLWHWLTHIAPELSRRSKGATFKQVTRVDIGTLELSLPPLAEQRRIAAILDKADDLRAQRRAALAALDGLAQSVFVEMFGGALIGAATVALEECAEVVSGVTKGRNLNGRIAVQVPYLRVANVQAGFLDLTEVKTIPALPSEVEALALRPGDVVMTEGGDFDKLGRGAMWEGQIAECIHQNHVFRVRVDVRRLLPRYFLHCLQAPATLAYFLRCAKRTTNLASVNMTQLRALPVVVPPLDLQARFAERVAACEKLKTPCLESAAAVDALFAAIQHRAFAGEL